ncbi:glutamate transporter polyphemus-like isoform X2 [Drosophila ficusphila]|uniref:glutamate transporter polyphemus-like isoform X2 n=1 Tax=Drosophila ficusphila TaxID=30025 RepID=UPI001C8ACB74|nr:glutamate transporter polyphemus-like isoform X2 [Drosophila ficusphila]
MPHDRTYDPYTNRNVAKPISEIGAFILLVKCIIGTGVLAMPLAFSYSGTVLGIVLLTLTSIVFIHGIHMLIYSMVECSRRAKVGYTSLPEAMVYSFSQGPKFFKYISKGAGLVGNVVLCLSAYLVCVVYLVFVAVNTKMLVERYFPAIDRRLYILIIGLVSIPPFCIMHLKYLIPFNFVANILIYSAFAMMSVYIAQDLPPLSDRNTFGDIAELPFFFIRVFFSVTSVGVLLAIEKKMSKPKNFLVWYGVVNSAFLLVIISYVLFGFFGYWRYGEFVEAPITLNLPHEPFSIKTTSSQTGYGHSNSLHRRRLPVDTPLRIRGDRYHNDALLEQKWQPEASPAKGARIANLLYDARNPERSCPS